MKDVSDQLDTRTNDEAPRFSVVFFCFVCFFFYTQASLFLFIRCVSATDGTHQSGDGARTPFDTWFSSRRRVFKTQRQLHFMLQTQYCNDVIYIQVASFRYIPESKIE